MTLQRRIALTTVIATTLGVAGCVDLDTPTQPQAGSALVTPEGWSAGYDNSAGVGLSRMDARTGTTAAYLSAQGRGPLQAVLSQFIKSEEFLGKRVRVSAWVKPKEVTGTLSGLWMRVDATQAIIAFDNMSSRPVLGSGQWRQISIVLDVPAEAIGIAFGALLTGQGTLIVDDLTFEVVPTTVPVTDLLTAPVPRADAGFPALYSDAVSAPLNLGFEGFPPVSDTTITWLTRNSTPLATTDPAAALTDLEPFAQMIGGARVIGLGESTHGTREFQRAKHRLFRYLVERQGFTHLAIEGSAPDAARINHYVLTGQGDPARLLSAMRFWITNTQEVLDLIQWMREWNTTAPRERRVQFAGVDFQQPGGAMDSVEAFIARVDRSRTDYVRARLACFDPYKSNGATFGAPMQIYAARLDSSRAACALGAREVYDLLSSNATQYQAASSDSSYVNALHSARLVQQWEAMATNFSVTNLFRSSRSRDSSMAENVQWIRDRAGLGAKMVIWAHNDHIGRMANTMGRHLATAYGSDYLATAFAFESGVLNAVSSSTPVALRPADVPTTWFEATLGKTNLPLLLLDTRRLASGGSATAPLLGVVTMRAIGSTYNVASPSGFPRRHQLPAHFDVVYFAKSTVETTLLPFVF